MHHEPVSLRSVLKRLARTAGFALVGDQHAARAFVDHPPRTTFDLVLLHCYASPAGLNFVQVGANDGQRFDPLVRYLEPCGWSGLMFEPIASNFAALRGRHGGNPRLRLRQQAVDAAAGRRTMYDLDRAAHPELPDWAHGLASFDGDRVRQAARSLGLDDRAVTAEEIVSVTWDDVWRDFGARRCDLLVIDTEGHDLPLLRLAGLGRHRPRIVHFEHACATREDRLAFVGELLDLGYELATDGPDTTAWLKA